MNTRLLAKQFFPHLLERYGIACVNAVLLSRMQNDASSAVAPSARWFSVRNQADETQPVEILIYDKIGKDWYSDDGVAAKDFAETLKGIPQNRDITVRINSPGGNVWDGLAIYNQLQARKERVTCVVDGIAASIASVIAMAGKETVMPANSLMMIHDPSGMAVGNAADMRKMADALDKHADVIATVYESKSGKAKSKMREMMTAETWMTAEEAKKNGLCNRVSEAVTINNVFDFSKFRNVPQSLKNLTNAAANTGVAASNQTQNTMNRTQIIAMLNRLGISFDANATDAQLVALLEAYQPPQAANPPAAPPVQTPPVTPAAAPTATHPASAAPVTAQSLADINAQLAAINAREEAARRERVTRIVDQAITETRIPNASRDFWINAAMQNESQTVAAISAIEPHPPGAAPVVAIVSESIPDIMRHFDALLRPQNEFRRSEFALSDTERRDIQNSAVQSAIHYQRNRDRIIPFLNTNTIPAGLQRNVILQEMMTAFAPVFIRLNSFSTRFATVPLEGTDKLEIAYYPLQTAASTDYNQENGYVAGNTTTEVKEITIDKRKYQGMAFTSVELARQPYLNLVKLGQANAEKLARDVIADILSLVKVNPFGAAVMTEIASAFDTDDIAELAEIADTALWPTVGRALWLHNTYITPLRKAKALTSVADSGSAQTLREGQVGRLSGFDVFDSTELPANGENLKGFISLPSAIGVVSAPILPAPGVRQNLVSYQVVTDPSGQIAFEYRHWGVPQSDTDTEVIECNYGRAALESAALKRICNQ